MKKNKEVVRGYKAFDKGLICRGFQYEIGKDYQTDEKIELCKSGFHFCRSLGDVYSFYSFGSVVAEVEAFGDVLHDETDGKSVTNGIRIIRILDAEKEAKNNSNSTSTGYSNTGNRNTGNSNTGDSNTGDSNTGNRNTGNWNTGDSNTGNSNTGNRNTGNWNTGNWNTGYSNTGNSNTGDSNTGNRNTGNWNTGNSNTGFFNTVTPEDILIFNEPCKRDIWNKANKPNFIYFDLTKWIEFSEMTDEEKENYPSSKHLGGYLKGLDYKEAWKDAWETASKSDRKLVTELPNFNWSVFTEISGIKKEDYEN